MYIFVGSPVSSNSPEHDKVICSNGLKLPYAHKTPTKVTYIVISKSFKLSTVSLSPTPTAVTLNPILRE
jgi:hypothetical protein